MGGVGNQVRNKSMFRVGHGFDLHRVVPGRPLCLGGIVIPWDRGLLGHSDADILIHALIDAILGALALGDIGQWFPDTEAEFRGIASAELLKRVLACSSLDDWQILNMDATVLAQAPKLAPHIPAMRRRLGELLELGVDRVSVKATTMEGVDAVGRGEAMSAHVVVLLSRRTAE